MLPILTRPSLYYGLSLINNTYLNATVSDICAFIIPGIKTSGVKYDVASTMIRSGVVSPDVQDKHITIKSRTRNFTPRKYFR